MGSDAVRGGDAVIRGGDGQVGTADFEAALAQTLEGLRRGDFMHQVQVDVEQRGRARLFVDYVGVPEFFDDGARHSYFRMYSIAELGNAVGVVHCLMHDPLSADW